MIRNNPGQSSYFGGVFAKYGRYQWNIKYYEFNSDMEVEECVRSYFGEDFEYIHELVGRPIEVWIDGRSGGWFVINSELTSEELKTVDYYIESCMKDLPRLLAAIREDARE